MIKREKVLEIFTPLLAVVAAFLVGGIFILIVGQNPFFIYGKLFSLSCWLLIARFALSLIAS